MYAYIYTYYITPLGFHFNAKVDTNYQGHWIPPHLFVAQMRTPPHSSQLILTEIVFVHWIGQGQTKRTTSILSPLLCSNGNPSWPNADIL